MTAVWRQRFFLVQCILGLSAIALLFLEFRTLSRIEMAERSVAQKAGAAEARALSVERVFAFPENTCAPKPTPAYPVQRPQAYLSQQDMETLSVASLSRQQFQYSLVLTCCVLLGLLTGVALSYRAAARETRLAQLKAGFVSNISHEMKTPLATIQMFAETLESGRMKDASRIHEYHAVIHKESRRLGQMIEDALDFARMENATKQYRFAPCDVNSVVDSACREFREQVELSGGELKMELSELEPLMADGKAIAQVLSNLLSNAIKYSPERKEIHVRTRQAGASVAIDVEDKGIGIPAVEHSRIFEQFYRVDAPEVHSAKGTGLGLAIVNHIVHSHEGEVRVSSKEGEGSCFTVLLPRHAPKLAMRTERGSQTLETAHR
ncbi:MAG: GHKL domain-containing protein [Acidobacteria bacterium]|nr:GHKL domain-containing protein [Acidobacteriota bacterium]